jgi:hypothetical protein
MPDGLSATGALSREASSEAGPVRSRCDKSINQIPGEPGKE